MDRTKWEHRKLREVCFYPNKRISISEISPNQYVGVESLLKDRGGVSFGEELPDADSAIEYLDGDILIGNIRPYLRKIWKADRYGGASGDVVNVRIQKVYKDYISPEYLYKVLSSDMFFEYDNANTHGAKMPRGDRKAIAEFQIPIPTFYEQQRIVAELDKLHDVIALKRKQLTDLDSLAQSLFYEMFGDPVVNEKNWEMKSFGELCVKISNGYNTKLEEDTYKTEGIMYFRCQNVWRNRFDYEDMVYIDEETNKKMKSSSLKHNDFLITKIGRINTENSSLGRISLYEGEDEKANLSGNLCFARLKNKIAIHKFVLYILISNRFRDYIRRTTVGGIDKRALNVKQISSFPIILPPLPFQQSFAAKIAKIEAEKQSVKSSLKDLETLLASRMQYWFDK